MDTYTPFVHVGSNPFMEQAAVHVQGFESSLVTPLCSVMINSAIDSVYCFTAIDSVCCFTYHAVHILRMLSVDRGAFPSHAQDRSSRHVS